MQIKDRPLTLGHKLRELIKNKLKISNLSDRNSLWDWQEGAKDTLNPIPAMVLTFKDIWTRKKTNVLNKIYNSWLHIFKRLFSKRGIYWRQSNGCGSHGSTHFKVWTLTHYKSHTVWDLLNTHRHSWDSKKSIFSKNWTTFNHVFNIGDWHGCYDEDVSYHKYHDSLNEQQRLQDKYESECEEVNYDR